MSRYGFLIAGRVRWFTWLAVILLWFSLYVSYLVYAGQVLTTENAALQAERVAHETRVKDVASQEEALIQTALRAEQFSGVTLLARGYCDLRVPPPDNLKLDIVRVLAAPNAGGATVMVGSTGPSSGATLRLYLSDRQRTLCAEGVRLDKRQAELVDSYGAWWRNAILLRGITRPGRPIEALWNKFANPAAVVANAGPPSAAVVAANVSRSSAPNWDLETYRYLMQQMINGLLAGIMPAMYAALGALASLFRRLSAKVQNECLGPSDYSNMASSLVLGVLTGAVIGLFANVLPQGGPTAGLPLTTTALALLAGYATDRVFGMFDNLADRVFVLPDGTARTERT